MNKSSQLYGITYDAMYSDRNDCENPVARNINEKYQIHQTQ